MRSIGTRRGNPLLRASIEMSARRRMEWLIASDPGDDGAARDGARAHALRFTRAFFDRIREQVLPRMAPALSVDGAEVRYFAADGLALWGMQSAQGLVLAYECSDTPALLAERARRWLGCLRTRTAPGMLDRTWGRPVYGARHDAQGESLEVVWATPGDWCGFVLADEQPARQQSLPQYWPQPGLAGT